jgi:hypothetical protein
MRADLRDDAPDVDRRFVIRLVAKVLPPPLLEEEARSQLGKRSVPLGIGYLGACLE